MRYGVCIGIDTPERVKMIADSGFDYVECGFSNLSRGSDEEFEKFRSALSESNIKCEVANCFIPGDLPIIGADADADALRAYIIKGMERGSLIGLKTVVFGSGGARSMKNGATFKEAFAQLVLFLKNIAAPAAAEYGIKIVIEPLRITECNMINTVKEGVMLASASGQANVGGLADLYHMVEGNDAVSNINDLGGCIFHAHICNPVPVGRCNRVFPTDEREYDYRGFIDALSNAGCERCSVEAGCLDFEKDVAAAGKLLKSL